MEVCDWSQGDRWGPCGRANEEYDGNMQWAVERDWEDRDNGGQDD